MANRWTDERDQERWRREQRYGRDDYGRETYGRGGYRSRGYEDRTFGDHEHDADWDHGYDFDQESWRAINYELRDPGYGYAPATGSRSSGYSGAPPYGGARAQGTHERNFDDQYGSPYERREPRPTERSRGYGAPPSYLARGYGAEARRELQRERDEELRDRERRGGRMEQRGFFDRAADTVASWFGASEAEQRMGVRHGHRGRGPKGYRRSDQRISDDVHDVLTDDPYLDASEITVTVANCEVTLAGVVSDRDAKHRAERQVERISGVDHVQNNLRIGQLEGARPFETGNPLTSPGRGFGDSVVEAQARGKTPDKDDGRH
jgi:hypothetical protein